jgi:hypothetical protein
MTLVVALIDLAAPWPGGWAATVTTSSISFNQAMNGHGNQGGSDGQGVGGGVCNRGTFTFDAFTLIAHNHASTSNDDLFP